MNYYPFAFEKLGVTSIKQIIRGEEYPYETLELNQNDELKDFHGYFRFLQATGPLMKSGDCMVKPDDWGPRLQLHIVRVEQRAQRGCRFEEHEPETGGQL